ncbi:MAG TPA: RluA family pseudouridine synthase [Acidobacteriota bacterium]|nr:RluA family pseudouridine synthase [Acidobacteriota bacterium]
MSYPSNPPDCERLRIVVPGELGPQRLDRYLAEHPDLALSRTRIQKLIVDGGVSVNGQAVDKKHKLTGGEVVELTVPPPEPTTLVPENIPLDIVFEDEHLLVVNKPPGLVTHPAAGNYTGTLANALAYHFGRLAGAPGADRPGIVHRLDKNTSGLLVVARNDHAYASLQQAIQSRELRRTYLAVVCGHMRKDSGTIDLPVGRSVRDRRKMSVTDRHSRPAVTGYTVTERFRSYDLLDVLLQTGRTHQIRVHFSHLGHPVLGDPDYGGRQKWHRGIFGPERPLAREILSLLGRQALHARRLEFVHPSTGEALQFDSEPPEDIQVVLRLLDERGR